MRADGIADGVGVDVRDNLVDIVDAVGFFRRSIGAGIGMKVVPLNVNALCVRAFASSRLRFIQVMRL